MADSRVTLERAIAVNTKRVVLARERLLAFNARQKQFLECAAGHYAGSPRRWFVITTAHNCEKVVHKLLEDAGITVWLPVEIERLPRRGSRPAIEKQRICWPGYVFVNIVPMPESWAGLQAIKHVTSILADGVQPIALKDKMIMSLKELVLSGEIFRKERSTVAPYAVGECIRVTDGPFALFPGVVEYCEPGDERIKIDIPIFGRLNPVWLDLDQIEKVE